MTDWIRVKQGQIHSLTATLRDATGPLDLPEGTTVTFSGVRGVQPLPGAGTLLPDIAGSAVIIRPGATADDPNRGAVRYDLTTTDVAYVGIFYCRWLVTPIGSSFSQPIPEGNPMILVVE